MTGLWNLATGELEANNSKVVGGNCKADDRNLFKKSKNAKFRIQMKLKTMGEPTFLTFNTNNTFN